MMVIKWALRALLLVVLAGAALAGYLLLVVDPNDFKPQIVSAVRDTTGREMTITGDLELGFFPYLAVSVTGVQLGNSQGFEGPFATLERAQLKARPIPLFFSRLEVVAVNVDGLSLFLTRDADGQGNWMDLATSEEQSRGQEEAPVLARDKRVPVLASLIVDGLHVSDARIVWDDRLKGDRYDVSGIGLDVSDFAFGQPFDVDTKAAAKIGDMSAELDFAAHAVLEFDRLSVTDMGLTASLTGPDFPKGPETIALTVDAFSTDGHVDNGRMQGLGLDMRFASRQVPGAISAGSLDVAPFNPRDVFVRLGIPLPAFADPAALGRTAFSCDWSADADRMDVSNLRLAVDNSTMQGSISVLGRKDPFVSLDLRVDALNLDGYRVHPAEDAPASTRQDDSISLPLRELRALNGNATLTLDEFTAAGVRCTSARVQGKASKGVLVLDSLQASAYGGRLQASGRLDVREERPSYSWAHDLSKLQIGPLLKNLHGSDIVTGTAQGTASVRTSGNTVTGLKRNLQGKFDFRVTDGALNGVNIPKLVRDGIRKLKGQPMSPDEPARTVFSVLSGSGVIDRGLETTNDLLLLAPRFKVTGGGKSDLVKEDMDFRLLLTLEGSEGKFDEGALGLSSFPVRVSGQIRSPVVTPDIDSVLRSLGLKGGRAVQETLKGIGSGVNKGVEGLKRLFQ